MQSTVCLLIRLATNAVGTFDMGSLVDINSTPVIDDTTTTTTTTTGGNGGGTTPTNVIATVPIDQQTGFTTGGQLYNPDVDHQMIEECNQITSASLIQLTEVCKLSKTHTE